MNMDSPGKRLSIFRKSLRLSQEEMGSEVGLNKTQIRDMESGKVHFSESRANLLHDRLGIRKEWLLTGQGPMKTEASTVAKDNEVTLRDITKIKDELIELHRLINSHGHEIGKIRDKMEEASQTGDIKRLGIAGGKGS
jgi:transcriptional regulator with XRE-family HTH domain